MCGIGGSRCLYGGQVGCVESLMGALWMSYRLAPLPPNLTQILGHFSNGKKTYSFLSTKASGAHLDFLRRLITSSNVFTECRLLEWHLKSKKTVEIRAGHAPIFADAHRCASDAHQCA